MISLPVRSSTAPSNPIDTIPTTTQKAGLLFSKNSNFLIIFNSVCCYCKYVVKCSQVPLVSQIVRLLDFSMVTMWYFVNKMPAVMVRGNPGSEPSVFYTILCFQMETFMIHWFWFYLLRLCASKYSLPLLHILSCWQVVLHHSITSYPEYRESSLSTWLGGDSPSGRGVFVAPSYPWYRRI